MSDIYQLQDECYRLREELDALSVMPDDEACAKYNVDFKHEAITCIEELLDVAERALSEALDYTVDYNEWSDNGFNSCVSYYQMRL